MSTEAVRIKKNSVNRKKQSKNKKTKNKTLTPVNEGSDDAVEEVVVDEPVDGRAASQSVADQLEVAHQRPPRSKYSRQHGNSMTFFFFSFF